MFPKRSVSPIFFNKMFKKKDGTFFVKNYVQPELTKNAFLGQKIEVGDLRVRAAFWIQATFGAWAAFRSESVFVVNGVFRCYLDFVVITDFWSKSNFGVIRTILSMSVLGAWVAFRTYYVFGVKGKASELFRFCSYHSFCSKSTFRGANAFSTQSAFVARTNRLWEQVNIGSNGRFTKRFRFYSARTIFFNVR